MIYSPFYHHHNKLDILIRSLTITLMYSLEVSLSFFLSIHDATAIMSQLAQEALCGYQRFQTSHNVNIEKSISG